MTAKLSIYRAFIEGEWEAPGHLARVVHEQYFNPRFEEFQPRTMWSLSNAFASAFRDLDAIPQFRAAAKLGPFLEKMNGDGPVMVQPDASTGLRRNSKG